MGGKYRNLGNTTGAKAQNAEFLARDAKPPLPAENQGLAIRVEVYFQAATAVLIQWTPDSGSTWLTFFTAAEQTAGELITKTLYLKAGDLVNFRTDNIAGVTLDYFRVSTEE